MDQEDVKIVIRYLALSAGISLNEDRVEALVAGLESLRQAEQRLARIELGTAPPAFSFQPPASKAGQ